MKSSSDEIRKGARPTATGLPPAKTEPLPEFEGIRLVALSKLKPDPKNPRVLTKERLANLCKSIEADPNFMKVRPILADAEGNIYAGNSRYYAHVKLGRDVAWAVLEDVPEPVKRRRRIQDNEQWGEWHPELLSEEVWTMRDDGIDVSTIGFDDKKLAQILSRSGGPDAEPPKRLHYCPSCGAEFTD